jgi:hypothetical protein
MPSKISEVGCDTEEARGLSDQSRVGEKIYWFRDECTLK